ncbi:hypothetical protein ACTXT7_003752 [Hymenolepis weldensis]
MDLTFGRQFLKLTVKHVPGYWQDRLVHCGRVLSIGVHYMTSRRQRPTSSDGLKCHKVRWATKPEGPSEKAEEKEIGG